MEFPRFLVLGTHNLKKRAELDDLLRPHEVQLLTLADFPEAITVVEDGTSFAENAALKASRQASHLQQWVLGEDSGLSVDALDGAPGIYSARYAGENANDEANNDRLLQELGDLPLEKRGAHYVCHVALANAQGEIKARCEATCHGRILFDRRGAGGFGYDPLFEILEYHRTFAEMGAAVKSVLSHRARALRALLRMVSC